ncbi:hypothetical protein HXX76_003352 [Chlamydomonas incerta]|uniref:HTH myb-type domain-containing protein n=1 Tax=Chlamydomonas incerta TaxID=51695 RepID=A0A835TDK2_CHLIN|nr:hypothetical protein HXX76_003352 [Chlamydomonas incerta]|eukprot:KAG2441737.1 hypothetical protein HXX76_003352 [Chlamydomonas incerta]
MHGTRWCHIAKLIPGRSENCVKNVWYSTCRLKDRERRSSLLYTYAQTVKDCSHDPQARIEALAKAEKLCATPGVCKPSQQAPQVVAAAASSNGSDGGIGPIYPALAAAEETAASPFIIGKDQQAEAAQQMRATPRGSVISNNDGSGRPVRQQRAASTSSAYASPVTTTFAAAGVLGAATAPITAFTTQLPHPHSFAQGQDLSTSQPAASSAGGGALGYGAMLADAAGGDGLGGICQHIPATAGGAAKPADEAASRCEVTAIEVVEVSNYSNPVLAEEAAAVAIGHGGRGAPFYTHTYHEQLQSQARRELKWQSCPPPVAAVSVGCAAAAVGGGASGGGVASDVFMGTLGKELDQLLDDVDNGVMDCEMLDVPHHDGMAAGSATDRHDGYMSVGGFGAAAPAAARTGAAAAATPAAALRSYYSSGQQQHEQHQRGLLHDSASGMRIQHGGAVVQPQHQHQHQVGLPSSAAMCFSAVDASAAATTSNTSDACAVPLSPVAHAAAVSGVASATGLFTTSSAFHSVWTTSAGAASSSSIFGGGGAGRTAQTASGMFAPSPVTTPVKFRSSAHILSCSSHLQPITDAACVLGLEDEDLAIFMA